MFPWENDQILVFFPYPVFLRTALSSGSDDPTNQSSSTPVRPASYLPLCRAQAEKGIAWEKHSKRHPWLVLDLLHAAFLIKQRAMQLAEKNCRTRVSSGRCHQCQQNYTPRECKPFKRGRYFKDYFKKVSKGNVTQNTWYSLFPRSQENLNSRNGLFPLWGKISWQRC